MEDDSDASVGQGGKDSDSESEPEVMVAREYKFSDGSEDDSDAGHNQSRGEPEKSDSGSGSADEDEDFAPKTKPSSVTKGGKPTPSSGAAERIPAIAKVDTFRFQRCIKKRQKGKPGKGFDVEYLLLDVQDPSVKGSVFRSKAQLKAFFEKEEVDSPDLSNFDFTQKYDEFGEMTEQGKYQVATKDTPKGGNKVQKKKKRRGAQLLEPRAQKKPKLAPIRDDHPLSRCVQILRDVMAKREAPPFLEPVDLKLWPSYLDAVKEPMDLGTVYERLCDGMYQTAHEVRRQASLVWLNCVLFNGEEAPITKDVKKLAKVFDEKFQEQIPAPSHMGMRKFTHGAQWVGHSVTVYFDDCRWYDGEIVDYDASKEEDHYQIKYVDDENCEWVSLPSIDITITDAWDALGKPIDPWQGLPAGERGAGGRDRPQRMRNATKQYVPLEGAGPAGGASKGKRKQDGGDAETPEKKHGGGGGEWGAEQLPRGEGEKRPEDFFCDDGGPCRDVCRCRLLFWCRFKTRKGVILGTTKGKAMGGGMKQERCSYPHCPHPTVSSNDRWHYISAFTASGGRDWSELLGQTLCSSCFQQYRSKGTLLRVRDIPTG